MLKGIDPILNAEVLGTLRAMGHGDDLILCDMNFPAQSVAARTGLGRLLRIDAPMPRVIRAVLSVYPIDSFVVDAAARMEVEGAPGEIPAVQREVQAEIDAAEGRSWPTIAVERVDREHRLRHPRQRGIDVEEEAERGLARDGVGREVGVAQDEVVAVAHGAQRLQQVGVQQRVDPLEHSIPLGVASS